ncbi:MAG: tetratricopeptide repeat protein [Proteobacteria bacterium]|nr:tetratricopeptide repeat protein [Pseudomonadota bacterium]MDA1023765.1 tetratricopeptide repeat protein [Pseudomonadota bacterium]
MNRKERRQQRREQKRAGRADDVLSEAPSPELSQLHAQAKASLDAGDMVKAEEYFRAITQVAPLEAHAFHMLALIAYQAGRLEEAGEMILEAITRNEDDPSIHANCGAIMNLLGRPLEAEAASRHAIDLKADYTEAHNNLAVSLEVQGRLDEAFEANARAIELNPEYTEAHINMGNLRLRRGDTQIAIDAYKEAIRIDPNNAMAHANLGAAYRDADDLEAAEEECLKAITLNPDYAEGHNSLGNLYKVRENWAAAEDAFRDAIKCREGYLEAHLNLAGILYKAGDIEGAIAKYQELIDGHEDLAEAHGGMGVVLLGAGRTKDATKSFQAAVDIKPTLGYAQNCLAEAKGTDYEEKDIAKLRELLTSKTLSDPDRLQIHFALGQIADQQKHYDTAFADFDAGNQLRKDTLGRRGKVFDADEFDKRVDAIIATYTPALLEKRKVVGDPTQQPVFIVGVPRTGTTLVEQILSCHPEVSGKGEMDLIKQLCAEDEDIAVCEDELVGEIAAAYLSRLREGAGDAPRIIDKMPLNFLYLGQIQIMFPGARIIHCKRDPLDTGLSCYQQIFSGPYAWACDLGDIGRFQKAEARLMAYWKDTLSLPILEIQYEDIIAEQEPSSRKAVEFLGLKWDPACLDFHKFERMVTTASNWQVRKPIYKSSIGRAGVYDKFLGPLKAGLGL